ncbi:unnamed protein product [Caenorhabditis nigoni]
MDADEVMEPEHKAADGIDGTYTDIGFIGDHSAFASHFRARACSPDISSDKNVFDDIMQRVYRMGGNYGNGSEKKGTKILMSTSPEITKLLIFRIFDSS